MSPWFTNPVWQNFSSLYREATTACEAKTDIEKSHHLTASLYFGIAALEAFLNQKMRAHLSPTKSEDQIFSVLRKGQFADKLKKWPARILERQMALSTETIESIELFNSVRGDLTHPKASHGHEIYSKLDAVEAQTVVESVASYMVSFHEAEGTRYPYWLFGWNYLNPRQDVHQIMIINDQQFCFSLQALGLNVPAADAARGDAWRDRVLRTFDGYAALRDALRGLDRCEPKAAPFPFQPKLCRRWWTVEHQRSCGNVTESALEIARDLDARPFR